MICWKLSLCLSQQYAVTQSNLIPELCLVEHLHWILINYKLETNWNPKNMEYEFGNKYPQECDIL